MSGVAYDYMDNFIKGLVEDHSGILLELEKYARLNNIPIVQKETARFLELMVTIKKPLNILELGTAIGYSAILMNIASDGKSRITTIERDQDMIETAKENIEKYGFKDKINVVCGDCIEKVKELNEKYDLIFIDAGKGHYNQLLPYIEKLLNEDGIIIADNVLFRGMVASRKLLIRRKITIVKRMSEYLKLINNSEKYITSVLPMGDGIAVTVRNTKK